MCSDNTKNRPWSPEERERAVELRHAGFSMDCIALKLRRSRAGSLRQILAERGLAGRLCGRIDQATVRRLYGQGMTCREIGDEMGAAQQTVRDCLIRLGLLEVSASSRFADDLDREERIRLYQSRAEKGEPLFDQGARANEGLPSKRRLPSRGEACRNHAG